MPARWFSGAPDLSESPLGYKDATKVKAQIARFGLATVVGEVQLQGCIMTGEAPEPPGSAPAAKSARATKPRVARARPRSRKHSLVKILHVADFHFRQQWFEWVAAQASQFDVVCFAGDLLNMWITRDVSLRAQTKWVREWARYRFKGCLFVCSGNHDWWTNDEITDTDASAGWRRKLARTEVTCDNHGTRVGGVFFYCHS